MSFTSLDHHIEITPGVCDGKPRITGRRITVQNIVLWHDRLGMSADEIATEHELSLAEVYAALAYYHDHRPDIDTKIDAEKSFVESLRQVTPSKLQEKLKGMS